MQDTSTCRSPAAKASGVSGTGRRWGRFLAGLTAILFFAFGVVPALQRLGPVREASEAIRNGGIDATALFYTESDVSSEAESSIRNAMKHSACRAD